MDVCALDVWCGSGTYKMGLEWQRRGPCKKVLIESLWRLLCTVPYRTHPSAQISEILKVTPGNPGPCN